MAPLKLPSAHIKNRVTKQVMGIGLGEIKPYLENSEFYIYGERLVLNRDGEAGSTRPITGLETIWLHLRCARIAHVGNKGPLSSILLTGLCQRWW